MFSQGNVDRIKRGRSPIVNSQWIKYNEGHSSYRGDKLIHHHIDQGRFAVGIPETAHNEFTNVLHPRKGNFFKGLRSLAPIVEGGMFVLDIFKMVTNHPDAPFSTFNPEGKLNTLYGISGLTDNPFQNNYYEIKSSNVSRTSFMVEFYNDFYKDDSDGRYRGSGKGYLHQVRMKNGQWEVKPLNYD